MEKEIVSSIAEVIFKLFVVNTTAAGIQQKNGVYITKYIPVTPYLIQSMILSKGSMGCYQQGYKTGYIKWICLDFDCVDKENPEIEKLYEEEIIPVKQYLDKKGIRYLTEFSGRRGIHVWIIFNQIIKKSLGFRIIQNIVQHSLLGVERDKKRWELDLFPATDSSTTNTVGKQVKFPLSTHKNGQISYFFKNSFEYRFDINTKKFLEDQYSIVSNYKENDIETVLEVLGLTAENQSTYFIKYKRYNILGSLDVTVKQVRDALSKTKLFQSIFDRMRRGQSLPRDWIVLMGTLSPCDEDSKIIRAVFEEFPNYDIEKTNQNIAKLKDRYFPATFKYLYGLYDLEIEKELDPEMTGFSFLCRELKIPEQKVSENTLKRESRGIELRIQETIEKEKNYLLNNDESPDIYIWNRLNLMKISDRFWLQIAIDDAISTGSFRDSIESFRIYERLESSERIRTLVSLSARDRVLTTHLALELCKEYCRKWKSFSYHPALTSRKDIFYAWYRSWGEYIEKIHSFLAVPFFASYEIFYIDLQKFYDNIDFLAVYNLLQNKISKKATNILRYLIAFNDSLMAKINNGIRKGVPQGPAYARIIAEIYLDRIICKFEARHEDSINIFRYVDDITVVVNPGHDSHTIYNEMLSELSRYGLPINMEKSQYFGKIGMLTEEQKRILLHADNFNYELRNDNSSIELLKDRHEKLASYLTNHDFDISSLSYIFGDSTLHEAKEYYFSYHRKEIACSNVGRGINFRRYYEWLFNNDFYLDTFIDERLFDKIPINSINFSNFINTLYLAVQNKKIDYLNFERLKDNYLLKIDEQSVFQNDRCVLNALKIISLEG